MRRRRPWIPVKYGPAKADDWFGVVRAVARYERAPGPRGRTSRPGRQGQPAARAGADADPLDRREQGHRAGPALSRSTAAAAESDRTGARERNVYALAGGVRPRSPACCLAAVGGCADDASGEHALFIEYVADVARLDASGAVADWPPELIDRALQAAASWQAEFWDVGPDRLPVARAAPGDSGHDGRRAAVARAARRRDAGGSRISCRAQRPSSGGGVIALIDTRWASGFPAKDRLPATLAHNDFNQRNVGFRPGVLVLDWELVEFNTAHRDLAEMLTFVLPEDARARAGRRACGAPPGDARGKWV